MNMKKRRLYAILLMLLTMTLTATAQRRGVGCWRGKAARQIDTRARLLSRTSAEDGNPFIGTKHGLVILAEFSDKKFKAANDREKYNNILNTIGYDEGKFIGSVTDYFRDQSSGLFNMVFDVVGPYTLKHGYKYYGENDSDGNDLRPQEMVTEMCMAADAEVNFADYDWDGDGFVDEVFVVYAGKGEANGGSVNTIWPHMWSIREATGTYVLLDGVQIDIYACSNELDSSGNINGIGTFCHEFSHCLGLPDFYDVYYKGSFGMSDFDLMSGGSYNGSGFCPAGYTAYEKMVCGWQDPIVLSDKDVEVEHLLPLSEYGDSYIIYNEGHPDEFYMIENRQKTKWDASLPSAGLMITHVDYDEEIWANNIPNSILTLREAIDEGLTCGNDHQRMTIFHADNDDDSRYWRATTGYYTKTTLGTDLYPYLLRDSLTATSTPAATLYNVNLEGTKLMRGAILDITQNDDLTMGFRYRAPLPVHDAIRDISNDSDNSEQYYNLSGHKVKQSVRGIYIVGGKKVVVR